MKKILILLGLIITTVVHAQEQQWFDVTNCYIANPTFKDGVVEPWNYNYYPDSVTSECVGFKSASTSNSKQYRYVYTYAKLIPGRYRISFYGFHRDGSIKNDWIKHLNANYNGNQNSYFYVGVDGSYINIQAPCASSAAQKTKIHESDVLMGDSLYVPGSFEGSAEWIKNGKYVTTYDFSSSGGNIYILAQTTAEAGGLFVLGGVKIEYADTIIKHKSITFEQPVLNVRQAYSNKNSFSVEPSNATLQYYEWSSSDENIAIVKRDGTVIGVKEGDATITATARDSSGVSASYKVVVSGPIAATKDNICISEVCVSNIDWVTDASKNFGSWIELYNPTTNDVDLNGLYLTDSKDDLTKAKVIAYNNSYSNYIDAGTREVLGFDHYDAVWNPKMIDFKLKYDGGTLYLTNGTEVIDSVQYPKGVARSSYVRDISTNTWTMCAYPTYGSEIDPIAYDYLFGSEQLAEPVLSEKGGFFTGEKQVSVTLPEGAYARYTTDGSVPTRWYGTIIEKDTVLTFTKSTPLRIVAYKDGYLNSDVVTSTYILKDKNYVLPSINITIDDQWLNSNKYGIFGSDYGRPGNGTSSNRNSNMDWDRPATFEYITAEGEYSFCQDVNISACGGWSRGYTPHSFKITPDKFVKGLNTLDYPFFENKPNIRHKALQIRNGGNDTKCRFIDPAIQEIVRRSGLNVNTQSWQPVHVFINGQYKYVLNMREPNNKHYAYSNYGYDTDMIDQFEMSPDSGYVQKVGTPDKYNEWYDLSENADDPVVYEQICNIVDIEQFINYMAVEFFISNKDWPQNNVKAFRSVEDGKFHFVLFDTDQAYQLQKSPFSAFNDKKVYKFDHLLTNDTNTPWKNGQCITAEIKLVTIFLNMLKNDTFRKNFIDTYCVCGGSVFYSSRVKTIIDEMKKTMNDGMKLEGGNCTSSYNTVNSFFTSSNIDLMYAYLKNYDLMDLSKAKEYSVNFSTSHPEAELFVNNIKVPYNTMIGKLYGPLTIRTVAPDGYRFVGWKLINSPSLPILDTNPVKEIYTDKNKATVRYFALWEKIPEAELAASNKKNKPIVINEVAASNDVYVSDYYKKADWIELYNTTDSAVNIAGLYLTDNLKKERKYQIPVDDPKLNTIIPSKGYKLIWCDKKDNIGAAIHASFKLEGEEGSVMLSKYNDSDDLLYSDTLSYTSHTGTESFGRYPDSSSLLYRMNKMTPGASNICQNDIVNYIDNYFDCLAIDDVYTDVHENSGIIVSYVGNGVINIKSENTLKNIEILTTSGSKIYQEDLSGTYTTISVPNLSNGIYIVKVVDNDHNIGSVKINVK